MGKRLARTEGSDSALPGPQEDNSHSLGDVNLGLLKRLRLADVTIDTVQLADGDTFVITKRIEEALSSLDPYSSAGIPVLVSGPEASGKTSIIEAYAALQEQPLLVLPLGEQGDPKALLGTYTASEGNEGDADTLFVWRRGVLAEALTAGHWICLDDIHLASEEMRALLDPLLEVGAEACLRSAEGEVRPAASCRIFGTISTSFTSERTLIPGYTNKFHQCHLSGLDIAEQEQILRRRHPSLPPSLIDLLLRCSRALAETANPVATPLRSLLRICSRVQAASEPIKAEESVSLEVRRRLLLEMADCLVGHLRRSERMEALKPLLSPLCLTESDLREHVERRLPTIRYHETGANNQLIQIGRTTLSIPMAPVPPTEMAPTMNSLQVMEKLAMGTVQNEPILLVGETGTGKTSMIQHLARTLSIPHLATINLSQQSEAGDLLGGIRPLSVPLAARQLVHRFEALFGRTFSRTKNATYLTEVIAAYRGHKWERLVRLLLQVMELAQRKTIVANDWIALEREVIKFSRIVTEGTSSGLPRPYFAFLEGALVQAMEEGHWILLDEINLATPETLQVLGGVLAGKPLQLTERACRTVQRHSSFRLFACMNPATDVAKRALPPSIRAKFTELYVDETDSILDDLRLMLNHWLQPMMSGVTPVLREALLKLYYEWRTAIAGHQLVDGNRKVPLLNLRTLGRALHFARTTESLYGVRRALYEGLTMTFLTGLDEASYELARQSLLEALDLKASPNDPPPLRGRPPDQLGHSPTHVLVENYLIARGPKELPGVESKDQFVLTPSVRRNVARLARAVMAAGPPILLEGPTSAGKTSVVEYLASRTGHHFVRINNHEHTDIQEYLGAYQPDEQGRLIFREGLLVEALRKGHWIVLDELNLAPSDVLEALNRLLDDNRELFVPELAETIRPHPSFHLFATQNPAGLYGGRKMLSRAFRSRFLEIQCGELPLPELEQIISQRCRIAPSQAARIGRVFTELAQRRTGGHIFAGRHAMVTLRDLFRWASRPMGTIEEMACHGYMVLAERLRHAEERHAVREAIEQVLKTTIDFSHLYQVDMSREALSVPAIPTLTWTKPMRRLYALVRAAVLNGEPVLLVGETGCGKTTVCQVLAQTLGRPLTILNLHQNSETADLVGSLRPCRQWDSGTAQGLETVREEEKEEEAKKLAASSSDDSNGDQLNCAKAEGTVLFAWKDGPLVECMREGRLLLLDEISLADDSVLERLNSVLEPGRSLTLAEAIHGEHIVAHKDFALLATMNPGGDYGKKELSPALRNRFTEIWVDTIGDGDDLMMIVRERLGGDHCHAGRLAIKMMEFFDWWRGRLTQCAPLRRWPFSVRDVLAWADFVRRLGETPIMVVSAAASLFVDPARSVAGTSDDPAVIDFRTDCLARLRELFQADPVIIGHPLKAGLYHNDGTHFGIAPFLIECSRELRSPLPSPAFAFNCPTTLASLQRVLLAMCLGRSVLLEGSPGVGKTALVAALAMATGHHLTRINLSEQTDLLDLFGSDAPTEGGQLAWLDGPFLRALRRGDWILLDELNLASQSVLEGLNACLDHRGTVFIPELGRGFSCQPGTRIFAAQNPMRQGGGRKGLPKSFLNRFIPVWIDPMMPVDMKIILRAQVQGEPSMSSATEMVSLIDKAVDFTVALQEALIRGEGNFGRRGAPWEFNLRDLQRWLKLSMTGSVSSLPGDAGAYSAEYYLLRLYSQRMRTLFDVQMVQSLWQHFFGDSSPSSWSLLSRTHGVTEDGLLHVGGSTLQISSNRLPVSLDLLPGQVAAMEMLMACISHQWLAILHGARGKSSLIRLLASLAGRPLIVVSLSRDSDTADLLGTFEQQSTRSSSSQTDSRQSLGFAWRDGPLVQALEQGHWLVLEHANRCPPAVLDRLNSLFEVGGHLVLSEAATLEPRIIRAHKDFRIFMTCSPGGEELSRAMRNRGVEIVLHAEGEDSAVERAAILRAAATSAHRMLPPDQVARAAMGSGNWNDLYRLGLVGEPSSLADTGAQGLESVPEAVQFWLSNDASPIFGLAPHQYHGLVFEQVLGRLKVNEFLQPILLGHWRRPSFSMLIMTKDGHHLVDESGQIWPAPGMTIVTIPRVPWKGKWRAHFAKLLLSSAIATRALLTYMAKLPSIADDIEGASRKVLQAAPPVEHLPQLDLRPLTNVDHSLVSLSERLVGPLGDTLKRWILLSLPLREYALLRPGHREGSLHIQEVARECLGSLGRFLYAGEAATVASIECQDRIRTAVMRTTISLLYYARRAEAILKDNYEYAECLLEDLLTTGPIGESGQRLVQIGKGLLAELIRLYASADPLVHYQAKQELLREVSKVNDQLVRAQTILRAKVTGDHQVPVPIRKILEKQQSKVQALTELLANNDLGHRQSVMARLLPLLDDNALLGGSGQLARYLAGTYSGASTLLGIVKTISDRLGDPTNSFDLQLPMLYALDLIRIGLEWEEGVRLHREVNLAPFEYPLFVMHPTGRLTSELVLEGMTQLSVLARLNLFLLYRRLEGSLGLVTPWPTRATELVGATHAEEQRRIHEAEAKQGNSYALKNDDASRDRKIAERLFTSTTGDPEGPTIGVAALSKLLDAVLCGDGAPLEECLRALTEALARQPLGSADCLRLLIEMAYRRSRGPTTLNVYKDPLPLEEAIKLTSLLRSLGGRVTELLAEFPENDTLQSLLAQCQRLLALPASTPILGLITALEHWLQKAQTWEVYASRAHRLGQLIDELMVLIVQWRRLELEGWRRVLEQTDADFEESAYERLLWLCQVIAVDYAGGQSSMEFVRLMDMFLLSAPLGEFLPRLRLLRRAQKYPVTSASARHLLAQTASYYEGVALGGRLKSAIEVHKRAMSEELKAALISTVWSVKSYWSVKETVERSHGVLVKQIRRYREFLEQPTSLALTRLRASGDQLAGMKEKVLDLRWRVGQMILQDPLAVRAFNRFGELFRRLDTNVLPLGGLDRLSKTIVGRLKELSSLTSKDHVQVKQKAYLELIRKLRDLGLRLATPIPEDERSSVAFLLGQSASAGVLAEESLNCGLSTCLHYWSDLQGMRTVHDDMGVRQVEAGKNAIFRAIEMVLQQRHHLCHMAATLNRLGPLVEALMRVAQMDNPMPLGTDQLIRVRDSLSTLLAMVREALELLVPHLQIEEGAETQAGLQMIKVAWERLLQIGEALLRDLPIETTLPVVWIEQALLRDVTSRLEELSMAFSTGQDLAPLSIRDLFMGIEGSLKIAHFENIRETPSIIDPSSDYVKEMQLHIQNLERVLDAKDGETDEFGLPEAYLSVLTRTFSDESLIKVFGDLERIIAFLIGKMTLPSSRRAFEVAKVLYEALLAIQCRLMNQHRGLLNFISVVASTLKTVFTRGYCRPPPSASQEEETSEGKKGHDVPAEGMGMAEGSGERNVSKEIEFEEQLTDLMKDEDDKNAESTDMNDDKDDDGGAGNEVENDEHVEMDADFDADTEETPQREDGKDGEDQEQEEEHLDDEMGKTAGETGGDLQELDAGWEPPEPEKASDQENTDDESREPGVEETPLEYTPEGGSPSPLPGSRSELEAKNEVDGNDSDGNNDIDMVARTPGEEDGSPDQEMEDDDDLMKEKGGEGEEEEEEDESDTSNLDNHDNEERASEDDAQRDEPNSMDLEQEEPELMETSVPNLEGDPERDESIKDDEVNDESANDTSYSPDKRAQTPDLPREEPEADKEVQPDSELSPNRTAEGQASDGRTPDAQMVDRRGTSSETVMAQQGTSSQKGKDGSSTGTKASAVDALMERIYRTIHQIQQQQQVKQEVQEGKTQIDSPPQRDQLYEEANEGNDYALGPSAEHGAKYDAELVAEDQPTVSDMFDDPAASKGDPLEEEELGEDKMLVEAGTTVATSHDVPEEGKEGSSSILSPDNTSERTWDQLEAATYEMAMDLCEQLRLILEPTKAARLQGDYRTGKRLNLRKIPSYIASDYRRDKIWLRRSKPSQRSYQILLSVDNSRSMGRAGAGERALEALATIGQALGRLEVGDLSVVAFGEHVHCLHPFGSSPWTSEIGRDLLPAFTFDEEHTEVASLLDAANEMFAATLPSTLATPWSLHLILSDGICHDHASLLPRINAALAKRIITVFVILDPSVCDISHVSYAPGGGVKMTKYLETFPFQFYVILRDLHQLPSILAASIRQWFECIAVIEQ